MPQVYKIDPVRQPCDAPDCEEQICKVRSTARPTGNWCSEKCFHRINWRIRATGSIYRKCGKCGIELAGKKPGMPRCNGCAVPATSSRHGSAISQR